MLKHENIIRELTASQKARILTDIKYLSNKALKILGVPSIKIGNIKDYLRDVYPHATVLSHSWNRELWEKIAEDKLSDMARDGVNLVIVPGPKVKLSPYRRHISEDTYLAKEMSESFIRPAVENGFVTAISDCYIAESDAAFMDKIPNERAINEFLVLPYSEAAKSGASLIISDAREPSEAYIHTNPSLQKSMIDIGHLVICEEATDENTVSLISRGVICLNGSFIALESAAKRYVKLKASVESGEIEPSVLDEEIVLGSAISEEKIDEALDRVLGLAFTCGSSKKVRGLKESERAELSLLSTEESSVLLKNKGGILPLDEKKSISIIGDAAFREDSEGVSMAKRMSDLLFELGYSTFDTARGYDFNNDVENPEFVKAQNLAKQSGTVLLFLSSGYERDKLAQKTEKLTLPANQLRLADSLSEYGYKVVLVIGAGQSVDVEFAYPFSAVLYAPLDLKYSPEAIVNILTGEYSPTGRLAYSLYSGTERAFEKRLSYKEKQDMKSGVFVGYRYYDTANMTLGYPFGHGLCYDSVRFSEFKVNKNTVSFNAKNTSAHEVLETVEIYAEIENKNVLRPKKELCAFRKIALLPHEEKSFDIPFSLPKIYYNSGFITEEGKYKIHLARSVFDVCLTASAFFNGEKTEPDKERLSDYLQSESNIINDNYTLEAIYKPMKKTFKNIVFGIISLLLAVSVGIFNSAVSISSPFLNIVAGILAIMSIVFFIIHAKDRNAEHETERKKIEEKNSAHFEGAEEIPVPALDAMFREEFDSDPSEEETVKEVKTDSFVDEYLAHVDKSFTLDKAVRDFTTFALDRGYKFNKGVIEGLFASLCTSRLIVLQHLPTADFTAIVSLLTEYFESPAFIDTVDGEYENEYDAFFDSSDSESDTKRNVVAAMTAAKNMKENVHFAALDGAKLEGLFTYVKPLIRYIKNPDISSYISIHNEHGVETKYFVPGNLWFIINPKENEFSTYLPETISKLCPQINLSFTKTQPAEDRTPVAKIKFYQMYYFIDRLSSVSVVSEELWKKLDKLEAYIHNLCGWRIGNKLWLGIEKHIAALSGMQIEETDAFDCAISTMLISSLYAAVDGKIEKDERSLSETVEAIFGEEALPKTIAFIKRAAVASAAKKEADALKNKAAENKSKSAVETDTVPENSTSGEAVSKPVSDAAEKDEPQLMANEESVTEAQNEEKALSAGEGNEIASDEQGE